jgi:curli production assembly/transport component CsgG
MKKTFLVALLALSLISVNGCASQTMRIGASRAKAGMGYVTATHKTLLSLPEPAQRIPVAVYNFRDQTGQYKPSEMAASFSTAVTQGATTILIKALEDSGWFIPIEREDLANLLTERKIIRQTNESYAIAKGDSVVAELPPLMYAGVMLEGGIISYDTNLVTSAGGLKFVGIGGSKQYRQDQIIISLRAVSTQNGVVLKTVNTSKKVLSREVDLGVFQFISTSELLESEIGFSTNEPVSVCIGEATEKAVQNLIFEGILMGLWDLKNPEDFDSPSIQNYLKQREGVEEIKQDEQ